MGFLDKKESQSTEQAVNVEKIMKEIQNSINVKINQQSEKIEELTKKIEKIQVSQVTASEMSDSNQSLKEAITENSVYMLGIGVILSVLLVICTAWLDWNTVEEDRNHTVQREIEQNYIDTKNVWRQGDTILYNQRNGTYMTVEEYEKQRADLQQAAK